MTLVDRKDPAAFEVFYDRHGGAAYSLAHRIVGDPGTAEDVTQEAFLSIWRSGALRPRPAAACGRGRWASFATARSTRCERLGPGAEPRPRRRGGARGEAGRRADRRGGDPPRDGRTPARSARRAAARAVAGDRARLLRRLQPLGDRGDARRAAGHGEGAHAARPGEGSDDPRGGDVRGRTCRSCSRELEAAPPAPTSEMRDDLAAYALGALDAREAGELEAHLDGCEPCRALSAVAAAGRRPAARSRSRSSIRPSAFARACWRSCGRTPLRRPNGRRRGERHRGGSGGGARRWRPATAVAAVLALVAGGVIGYSVGDGEKASTEVAADPVGPGPADRMAATLERDGDAGTLVVRADAGAPQRRRLRDVARPRRDDGRGRHVHAGERRNRLDRGRRLARGRRCRPGHPGARGGSRQPTSAPLLRAELG